MKLPFKKTFVVLSLLYLLFLTPLIMLAHPQWQTGSNVILEEVDLGLTDQTLKEWYESQTENRGHVNYFGIYATLPIGNDLYMGFGSARPAEQDGAYFAKFDGFTLTGIGEPDEQGFHEMIYDGALIHIAGTDPRDDHTAGTHYTYSPDHNSFTKYRNPAHGLVNVYHTWGLWYAGSTLYAAVGAHDGHDDCNVHACMGQIFSSTDSGLTWQKRSDLGTYRAYDITRFDGDLFASHNDPGMLTLSKSTDGGDTWQAVPGLENNLLHVNTIEFNGRLLAVSFDRRSLYGLDADDRVSNFPLPTSYLLGASYPENGYADFNLMVVVDGWLYLIAEKQSLTDPMERAIIRTQDFNAWQRMVHTDERLISLAYWPEKNRLITSTSGINASLWQVDLSGTPTAVSLQSVEVQASLPAWYSVGIVLLALILLLCRQIFHWRGQP